ncbi:hypothetical protein [Hoeflea poritis]|uniref:Uncharacterized protein n=1 Tax=Hoeflea poritis TaxID=2993659 RepID=A0ABT4VUK8_9HYPH|nr:hypothetical protein [Hoeflea poritis]MDA4848397.1 hypothetical protein [Hoeflea poritis]
MSSVNTAEENALTENNVTLSLKNLPSIEIYLGRLAGAYNTLAGTADNYQTAAALTIIGAAGTAAGALTYGGNMDLLKGAALTAASANTLAGHFQPGKSTTDFLDAARQATCMKQATTDARLAIGSNGKQLDENPVAIGILTSGILQVRTNLKIKLARGRPNYEKIVAELVAAAKKQAEAERAQFEKYGTREHDTPDVVLAKLKKDVTSCVA